jgi:hypothetical protein
MLDVMFVILKFPFYECFCLFQVPFYVAEPFIHLLQYHVSLEVILLAPCFQVSNFGEWGN